MPRGRRPPDFDLSVGAFRAWLAAQPPDAIVGTPSESETCPIANYLLAHGAEEVDVVDYCSHVWVRYPQEYRRLRHEPWAREFIQRVDRRRRPIRAALALKILDEAVRVTS